MPEEQRELWPKSYPVLQSDYSALRDSSFWVLIASNLLAMVLAVVQEWDLGEAMWIYWFQSVMIGIINAIRMFSLKDFSTEGLTSNDQPVPETESGRNRVTWFFLFHYGGFHAAYVIFLLSKHPLSLESQAIFWILLGGSAFAGAHIYSFWRNAGLDFRSKKPNLGTLLFYPYMRILPMHFTILFGGLLPVFMVLKTLADAGMHAMEHALFQRRAAELS